MPAPALFPANTRDPRAAAAPYALACPRCFLPLLDRVDPRFCPRCGLGGVLAAAADTAPIDFTAAGRTFRITDRFALGSFTALYNCLEVAPATGVARPGLFKIARDPVANDRLANEAAVLRRLRAADRDRRFTPFFPEVIASLIVDDASVDTTSALPARRGNILKLHDDIPALEDLYTLADLRAHFFTGLDARHVAWIWRRLLTVLGFVHRQDVLHAAVLPPHVLVDPADHKLILVGWSAAIPDARARRAPLPRTTGGFGAWYARQGAHYIPPAPALDIALAARCMIDLLGGDPIEATFPAHVDPALQRYFTRCLTAVPKPPSSIPAAWTLLDDFDRLIEALWGPRRFVPLHLPPKRAPP